MISRTRNFSHTPDRELVELGREYIRLHAIEKEAYEKAASLLELYESKKPVPSDIMRHTLEDWWAFRFPFSDVTQPIWADERLRHNPFYTEQEVAELKQAPMPGNSEAVSAQGFRAEEIISEWHRWKAECDALDERLGCSASRAAALASTSETADIADKIAALPARTIEGLKVRAMVLKLMYSDEFGERPDDTPEGLNVWAMICDIEAMQIRAA